MAVLFFVAAAVALAGAIGVVTARNPVHSALFLVMTLATIAVFFLMQDAQLVAIVQIVVYASAIVVLFLFVIMLLGVDRHEMLGDLGRIQGPAAIGVGVLLIAELGFLVGRHWALGQPSARHALETSSGGGNVQELARSLFTDFLWPFQVTAVLLVIAVVGGVVLARRAGPRERAGDDRQAVRP